MLLNHDEREWIKLLWKDTEAQLAPEELNEILTNELARPAGEADAQLLEDVLESLETEIPFLNDSRT